MQPTDLQRSVSDASARSVSQRTMRLLSVSTLLLFFCTSGNRDARLDGDQTHFIGGFFSSSIQPIFVWIIDT